MEKVGASDVKVIRKRIFDSVPKGCHFEVYKLILGTLFFGAGVPLSIAKESTAMIFIAVLLFTISLLATIIYTVFPNLRIKAHDFLTIVETEENKVTISRFPQLSSNEIYTEEYHRGSIKRICVIFASLKGYWADTFILIEDADKVSIVSTLSKNANNLITFMAEDSPKIGELNESEKEASLQNIKNFTNTIWLTPRPSLGNLWAQTWRIKKHGIGNIPHHVFYPKASTTTDKITSSGPSV